MKHDPEFRLLPGEMQDTTSRRLRLFEISRQQITLEDQQQRWRNTVRPQVSMSDMIALRRNAEASLRAV